MVELITPAVRLRGAWLEARGEWGPGLHEDGFGVLPSDDVESVEGFADWVGRLAGDSGCVYRWVVQGERVMGGIALRVGPSELVREVGHVGYGIRPSARRRGLAAWALGRMVDEARGRGLERVLIVCAAGN